jgi:hypothetical protein
MRGYPADSSVRWPARRVQSSIIAQADTLYSYALPTASRTRSRYPRVGCLLRRSLGSVSGRVRLVRTAPIAPAHTPWILAGCSHSSDCAPQGCRWVMSVGWADWQRNGVAVTAL